MRRERRNRVFTDNSKKIMYIGGVILVIAMIAVITYLALSILNEGTQVSKSNNGGIAGLIDGNSAVISTQIGKSVNEITKENTINVENTKTENKTTENKAVTTPKKVNSVEKEVQESNTDKKIEKLTFIKPVEGNITKEYAKDTLVYSETLEEWTTHLGVDIKADKTTIVKSSAVGKVKSIKTDPRYGLTVIIEHADGYETLYANLLTAEFVKVGEEVKQGQTIGTVGTTAIFEVVDGPHLHFEILKDNEKLDPSLFIG